jgi:hypothetical protein
VTPRAPNCRMVARRFKNGWDIRDIAEYRRRFNVKRDPPWTVGQVEEALRRAMLRREKGRSPTRARR